MNKETITKVAIGVGGLAVGGGAGYLLAKKQLEGLYVARAEEEIEQVREMYKRRAKTDEYETPEKAVEALVVESTEVVVKTDAEEYVETVESLGYSSSDGETVKVIKRRIFDEPEPTDEELGEPEESRNIDTSRPYEISTKIFMEDDIPDKVTLTYYATDDVVTDERDQPLSDVDAIIGEQHLDLFDEKTNVVYVRNEGISTDFEILLQKGAYSVIVLGNDDSHLTPKQRRGRPQRDDD